MDVNLRGYVRVLFKRKVWVVAGLLGMLLLGAGVTARTPSQYQATTTLFVGQQQVAVKNVKDLADLSQAFAVTNFSVRFMKSYAQIITSRTVVERAISQNGLRESAASIREKLQAQVIVDTQVIQLTYLGRTAAESARVTNAVAAAFIDQVGRLQVQPGQGRPLVQVSVIDPAVPPDGRSAPLAKRNLALALILGLMVGVGLAFLRDHLDVSVKSQDDVEELGIPVLGAIPKLAGAASGVHLERDPQGAGGEAFRKLRTSVGFLGVDVPLKTILVTSPVASEGKTTVALNVAAAFALSGFRTLLLEADLRRPSLHRRFGTVGTGGLTTAIVGEVPLNDAIVHTRTRNLSVLVAGAIPPNPVELLGSDQMADILDRLKQMFDAVIIDSPPLVPVADPATIAGQCDGVVIVTRSGKTDKRRLVDAVQIVERSGARLLGVVLNFLKPTAATDSYRFYSGTRAQSARTMAGKAGDA